MAAKGLTIPGSTTGVDILLGSNYPEFPDSSISCEAR